VARRYCGLTLADLGRKAGGMDYTQAAQDEVVHACER